LGVSAFKYRGAANAVALLTEEEAEKGIVAHRYSTHGPFDLL
jgi:threonine dehydratase